MVLSADRRVMLLNRALEALTGFVQEEVAGIPCCFVLRSSLCLHGCQLKQAAQGQEQVCTEANIVNKNRQKIPVRLTVSPILDVKGNLVGFVESVEDLRALATPADEASQSFLAGKLLGRSPEMQRILKVIPVIAETDSSVLITGQTGTGKDCVAEAIHHASTRTKGPFIKINCGALPETLLESELFGHQKGAFTGAVENKPGRFRLAHNGTVYLTEIGDLPLNLQVKLLSFLDDKVLYPLGSTTGVHVDVRMVAATHRNLEKMVMKGQFRKDLLFRLNVIRLHLPPLVQRGDDRKILLDHFLHLFNHRFKKKVTEFSHEAKQLLLAYPFPGNVRELRNVVEYAVNMCQGSKIRREHLPAYIFEYDPDALEYEDGDDNGLMASQSTSIEQTQAANWSDAERKMILDAMVKARGRRTVAAKLLGWGRATLWRKMKHYGMES
ncbi:MAG: sigma 54-interacting transcriptional regulator [Desulfomonile tiedjei]|nr:sigma 54-interacting transcriptional regulator [Desulfomonile tiedjei]